VINASFEELIAVEEIGERIARSIIAYFQNPSHIAKIEELRRYGLQFEANEVEIVLNSDKLEGKSFIISGVFKNYSRDELTEIIEANGGKILSGISGKLNYVIAGENMGPAKLEKANKLNIPIISDQDVLKMLE
jgi:DNA ligase (NAD+)